MPNQLLTSNLILNECLLQFQNNLAFAMTGNRAYTSDFNQPEYKPGDTVNIRKPNQFIVSDGATITAQDTIENSVPLTINHQLGVALQYTSKDLTLKIDEFSVRYVQPAMRELAQQVDFLIASEAQSAVYNFVGTPGTPVGSFGTVNAARGKLTSFGVSGQDRYGAFSITDSVALQNSLQNAFNTTLNTEISMDATIGRLAGMDMYESQNIVYHTAGVGDGNGVTNGFIGAGTVAAPVASGNTINLIGLDISTQVFNAGDVIEIDGVNSVTVTGRKDTGNPMQFVVTANVTSDGSGNATVPISPSIISDTNNPYRNVTNAIPGGSEVTLAASHNVNLAYQRDALIVAMPPLYLPESAVVKVRKTDPDSGISMRLTKGFDLFNDREATRIDLLLGYIWNPQYATRVLS